MRFFSFPEEEIEKTEKEQALELARELDVKLEISRSNDGLVRIIVWDGDSGAIMPANKAEQWVWMHARFALENIKSRRTLENRTWSDWETVS